MVRVLTPRMHATPASLSYVWGKGVLILSTVGNRLQKNQTTSSIHQTTRFFVVGSPTLPLFLRSFCRRPHQD
jgi:hypothetical protein